MSRSTSRSVRYSRVRTSAFLGRRGVTFRFTVSGDTSLRAGFGIQNNAPVAMTFGKVAQIRKVCKGDAVTTRRRAGASGSLASGCLGPPALGSGRRGGALPAGATSHQAHSANVLVDQRAQAG